MGKYRRRDNRQSDIKQANAAYSIKFGWFNYCVYCGLPATERDHVMPLSITARTEYWRPGVRKEFSGGLWLVPCCQECNQLAGTVPFTSILRKREYIHNRLKDRYKKELKIKPISDEDMGDLGPRMHQSAVYHRNRLEQLELRLAWPAIGPRRR